MKYFIHRSNRFFSVLATAFFMLCAGSAWGADVVISVTFNSTLKPQNGITLSTGGQDYGTVSCNTASSNRAIIRNTSSLTIAATRTGWTVKSITLTWRGQNDPTSTSVLTITGGTFNSLTSITGSSTTVVVGSSNDNNNYQVSAVSVTFTEAPACVAPSSVAIGDNWLWFAGETMTLTATPTGGNGPITYQWYKGGKADGNAIDGATNATFSKTCAFEDAGSYYCKVTCGGTQSTWGQNGDAYEVKVPRLYVKTGRNDGVRSDYGNVDFTRATASTATASISLDSNLDYCFNIADGCGHYYGNAGTMQYNNYGPWVTNVNGTDCGLTTMNANAGTYIFTINYSNWTQLQTTVTFPSSPTTKTVYMKINYGNWKKGDERYAIYCFGSGEQWYNFTLVDGACGGPIYKAEVDLKYTGYVICRMNGATTENNWDNRWDQTYDITAANGIYCKITGMSGGKATYTYEYNPFKVCVSGTWLAFTGETITLTATSAGATNFQWYKGGTEESNKITGATSTTYTKASCT